MRFVLGTCLCIFGDLFSSPIGNPSLPLLLEEGVFVSDQSWSCPELAYGGDFLFEKSLQPEPIDSLITQIELDGISQLGQVAWCARERFLLQLDLGSGRFDWRCKEQTSSFSTQFKDGLIWSASAKLVLLEIQDTSIAVDGHAGGWDWMKGSAKINGILQTEHAQSKLRYWQFAVGITQKIAWFAPYLGVAVNQTRFQVHNLVVADADFQSDETVGPFIGCSLTSGSRFLLNLEWRGWFENGFSIAGQLRF